MNQCKFCQIVSGQRLCPMLWENNNFIIFLDQKPIEIGHALIIPKKHFDYIFDIEKQLYEELFEIALKLSKPLKLAFQVKHIGIAAEGFGIPHAHLHLVPLNSSELLLHQRLAVEEEELNKTAEKIKKLITF